MVTRRTIRRIKKYGIRRIFLSHYLLVPAIAALVLAIVCPDVFSQEDMGEFISAATGVSQSLIAVTLSGLAILVSFSDRDFLSYFRKNGGFDELLFIFEYTVLISLITSLSGVILQAISYGETVFFIFLFLFIHLLLSVSALVSTVLRFAESKSDYETLNSLSDEEIPEELKEDMEQILTEIEDENSEGPNTRTQDSEDSPEPE